MDLTHEELIRHQLALIEWSLMEHAAGSRAEDYVKLAKMRLRAAIEIAQGQRNSKVKVKVAAV